MLRHDNVSATKWRTYHQQGDSKIFSAGDKVRLNSLTLRDGRETESYEEVVAHTVLRKLTKKKVNLLNDSKMVI